MVKHRPIFTRCPLDAYFMYSFRFYLQPRLSVASHSLKSSTTTHLYHKHRIHLPPSSLSPTSPLPSSVVVRKELCYPLNAIMFHHLGKELMTLISFFFILPRKFWTYEKHIFTMVQTYKNYICTLYHGVDVIFIFLDQGLDLILTRLYHGPNGRTLRLGHALYIP